MNSTELQEMSNAIRLIVADAVEIANSGHLGMPIGFADVFTVLAANFLQFDPQFPKWDKRDRLILSVGHGSMLLYAFYYLAGYRNFTLDDVKNFRCIGSKSPGHPEYGSYDAIEATTGPLGQGIANAVGMAIAAKKLDMEYTVFCIVGDGCMMEGITHESASLAGHLMLDNLIVLFDNNDISIDGSTKLTTSDDHTKKMEALGWYAQQCDGHNFAQIDTALSNAILSNRPSFISFKTTIAKHCTNQGSHHTHSGPIGKDEINKLANNLGYTAKSLRKDFQVSDQALLLWREAGKKDCNTRGCDSSIPSIKFDPVALSAQDSVSTRMHSALVINEISKQDGVVIGSADLAVSNGLYCKHSIPITKDNPYGNYIHYGVREAAMGGIMNGLALGGLLPIGGTFLVFSDYMRPSIRLAAISGLKVIYVMTHDSIGVGEDGPTHQPVEQIPSLRAIPNLLVCRPADYAETIECWDIALKHVGGPVLIALTRQATQNIRTQYAELAHQGAYISSEPQNSDNVVGIYASGSELQIAYGVKKLLPHLNIKIVSVPCFEIFWMQSKQYIQHILGDDVLRVGIEASCGLGWSKIIGSDGLFCGVESFGVSAKGSEVYDYFGLNAHTVANKIIEKLIFLQDLLDKNKVI